MALPSTGAISMSQVNTELGRGSTTNISLNETAVRTLAGKASGQISMSDLRGKSNAHTCVWTIGARGSRYGFDADAGYGAMTNRTGIATPRTSPGYTNTIQALYQESGYLYLVFSNGAPGTIELLFNNEFGVLYFSGWTQVSGEDPDYYRSRVPFSAYNLSQSKYQGRTATFNIKEL